MECIEGELYLLYLVLEVLIKRHIYLLKMIKVNIFYTFFPFKYLEISVKLYKMSCSSCFCVTALSSGVENDAHFVQSLLLLQTWHPKWEQ